MSRPFECLECARVFQWGRDDDSHLGEAAGGNVPCGDNAYWKLQGHMQKEHADSGFRCRRRGESAAGLRGGIDFWNRRDGRRACSYCGSMHPDDMFAAIEAGQEIGTTDKSYKIYVGPSGKFYFQHLSEDEMLRFVDVFNADKIKFSGGFGFYVAPFFMTMTKVPA